MWGTWSGTSEKNTSGSGLPDDSSLKFELKKLDTNGLTVYRLSVEVMVQLVEKGSSAIFLVFF